MIVRSCPECGSIEIEDLTFDLDGLCLCGDCGNEFHEGDAVPIEVDDPEENDAPDN